MLEGTKPNAFVSTSKMGGLPLASPWTNAKHVPRFSWRLQMRWTICGPSLASDEIDVGEPHQNNRTKRSPPFRQNDRLFFTNREISGLLYNPRWTKTLHRLPKTPKNRLDRLKKTCNERSKHQQHVCVCVCASVSVGVCACPNCGPPEICGFPFGLALNHFLASLKVSKPTSSTVPSSWCYFW